MKQWSKGGGKEKRLMRTVLAAGRMRWKNRKFSFPGKAQPSIYGYWKVKRSFKKKTNKIASVASSRGLGIGGGRGNSKTWKKRGAVRETRKQNRWSFNPWWQVTRRGVIAGGASFFVKENT